MRHHYIFTRKAKSKKAEHTKCWLEYGTTGTDTLLVGIHNGTITLKKKTIWEFVFKSQPYSPPIPFLCVCPREMKVRT